MKSAKQWISEYSKTHRHPLNQLIHKICVPLIFWSVFALLWSAPRFDPRLNWALVVMVPVLIFYWRLGTKYLVEMTCIFVLVFTVTGAIESFGWPLRWIAIQVFVAAWIGQFYGHHVEGARPAFLDDLQFLLIGPLWTLHKLKNPSDGY
jgi:uncharacterized membrane protein YGL010W